jgi:anhydro-N-acetylmuramic acid kinase
MVMDLLVARHTADAKRFDAGGRLAASGKVNRKLLERLSGHAYYRAAPPKAAGREQYGREFVDSLLATNLPMLDLIATATAFTAATIANGIQRFVKHSVDEVIASGGGVHNRTLMAQLQAMLPSARLRTSSDFGIDSDAKEAIAFAILAHETWHKRPSNLPSATGATKAVILGKVSY